MKFDSMERVFPFLVWTFEANKSWISKVPNERWQSRDTEALPGMAHTYEMTHVQLVAPINPTSAGLAREIGEVNLPWAEDHFQERIGGKPLNPPPSEEYWPYRVKQNSESKEVGGLQFSHTYPERFWPKEADLPRVMKGIRYRYGDLGDLIHQLRQDPMTRQAFLPVWFPEDTGNGLEVRVPCTIGYQFLFRPALNGVLVGDIVYTIRSCDLLRHFCDDVYMAGRLLHHIIDEMSNGGLRVALGKLVMNITSLHIFEGDLPMVTQLNKTLNGDDEDEFPSSGV